MARYIDADALKEKVLPVIVEANCRDCPALRSLVGLANLINEAPTIDAAPVVHGKWINTPPYTSIGGEYKKAQRCSVCNALYISAGNTPYSNHRYCAECGAKMDDVD